MLEVMPARLSPVRRCRASRGFTLVELMVVVAITGILATIGVHLVRGHMLAAKSKQAAVGVQACRVAEEAYRAQSSQYLNVSTSGKYYPMQEPGIELMSWRRDGEPDSLRWQMLGVPLANRTQFGFLVNAGRPGDTYPTFNTESDPGLQTPTDVWYVIQVRGDVDGDKVFMNGIATSYNGELYIEHEGE
jgi:prepilin-type N-terminal cleavage/methylation domain-containing protein